MVKYWLAIMSVLVLSVSVIGFMPLEVEAEDIADVELTDEQKDEIRGLQMEALEKQKEIINKYVEFGVFTEEKGQKIIGHMDEAYTKLEENEFIPRWDKRHGKHGNEDVDVINK